MSNKQPRYSEKIELEYARQLAYAVPEYSPLRLAVYDGLPQLTPTETAALYSNCLGETIYEIAERTNRSSSTVNNNLGRASNKIGAQNILQRIVLLDHHGSLPIPDAREDERDVVTVFTLKKLRVIQALAFGMSTCEAARALDDIKPSTVNSHCQSIFGQIGVHSKVDLVRWAISQDRVYRFRDVVDSC